MQISTIIIVIIMFGVFISVHEFGHFIVAKMSGIEVLEFSIGFGPTIIDKEYKGTKYSLKLLPLGGFVRMLGEDEDSDSENAFCNKNVFKRIAVVAAGPIMNFIIAILIFSISAFSFGVATLEFDQITEGGLAESVGIVSGDKIKKVNDEKIYLWEDFSIALSSNIGEEVTLTLENDKELRDVTFVVEQNEEGIYLGVTSKVVQYNLLESIKNGTLKTWWVIETTLSELARMISSKIVPDFVGPVGITYLVNDAAQVGLRSLLYLIGLISASMGLTNLLPIPALDGSRLVFLIIEAIRRKPVPQDKEALIHGIGFMFLMLLSILIIFKDVFTYIIK